MANKPRANKSKSFSITVSEDTAEYLDALVNNGGYFGNSIPEAAASIVEDRVVDLVKEGFLDKGQIARKKVREILGKKKKS